MKKIEHYRKLLGVLPTADLQTLKTTYRNVMKECHPDKFQDNEVEKTAAEKKSKIMIEAYHFLVSVAPETILANKENYELTLNTANIENYEYKGDTLRIDFSDGNSYEYLSVPKATYVKLVNAPTQNRFVKRHISDNYLYRSVQKTLQTS